MSLDTAYEGYKRLWWDGEPEDEEEIIEIEIIDDDY